VPDAWSACNSAKVPASSPAALLAGTAGAAAAGDAAAAAGAGLVLGADDVGVAAAAWRSSARRCFRFNVAPDAASAASSLTGTSEPGAPIAEAALLLLLLLAMLLLLLLPVLLLPVLLLPVLLPPTRT
jgi:hypothetical protein